MKNRRRIFILLCCQIVLSLFSFNITKVFADNVPPKKPEETALFKTIIKTRDYIVKHQNQDGGWPLVPGEKSDVEITALAIWALTESGWGTGSRVIRQGVRYLRNKQHEDGGWNNNTAHTTFALIALANAKTDPDARLDGLQWLKNAQNPSGSWGRKSKGPGHILYTSVTLAGFGKLIWKRFSPVFPGAAWLENFEQRNHEGYWMLPSGTQSDIFITSWVLHGISRAYNVDKEIAWLKQFQNDDGGFPRFKGKPSDPEVTAAAVMALAANNDLLNTRRIAMSYFTKAQKADGSFVSDIPIELKAPVANLQSTCFVLIAIHAKADSDR
ncbi:MAG: terpene cyclase/mutase family protein [Candidatus Poribacteria bacterium]|nr:terpene cyclase/mutase family protein [Candidatus Poribacteria bacterium]